ncbi:HAMP domain-containing sensor histidine kinase [Draconibacterium sediminis]|uniref:sensor histidine kinase n=1 Tax=Draconibacterium sediminis TaxID=1544798 RepID=UPI0026F19932|nr:HAMP domain-containing sensor histidine kinase [Draconibacterium sediminis]
MKLLSKTLRYYLYFSLPIFLLSSIGFYYALRQVMIHQVDESLKEDQEEIIGFIQNNKNDVSELYKKISCSYYLKETAGESQIKEKFSFVLGLDSVNGDYERFRELRTPVKIQNKSYELVLQESFVQSDSMIISISIYSIFLFGLVTLGISLVNLSISKRLWLPFYAILQRIKSYQPGKNKDLKFNGGTIDEFKTLSTALNEMSGRVDKSFANQKRFIDNVSHELQTPLMLAKSNLELLFQQKRIDAETAELYSRLDTIFGKMKQLNNSLLLLSRIENEQFSDSKEIKISGIITDYIEQYKEQIELKKIKLETSIHNELVVKMNPVLAEILIGNLIRNSIVHNDNSGDVLINISRNIMEISNTGPYVDIDPEMLFGKYVHYGKSENSTGLGLSIVKEICNYYGFVINYKIIGKAHVVNIQFDTSESL